MDPDQLRDLIDQVLHEMNSHSSNAVELLMLTAAQESHCGQYIAQIKGPALGIFQMEPTTHKDIWDNYLKYRDELAEAVRQYQFHGAVGSTLWRGNIPYQIAMARANYRRKPGALPWHLDIEAMAKYYKKHWNTKAGKATVEEAMTKYNKYAF